MQQTTQTSQYESKKEQIHKKYAYRANLYNKMNDIELNFKNMRGRVQKYFTEYPSKQGGDMRIISRINIDEPEKRMHQVKKIMYRMSSGVPLGDDDNNYIKSLAKNKINISNKLDPNVILEQNAAEAYKFFQQFQEIERLESEATRQVIKTGIMYLTIGAAVGGFVFLTGAISVPSAAVLQATGAGYTLFGQAVPTSIASFMISNKVMLSFKIMTVVQSMFTQDITEIFKTMGSETISLGLIFVSSNYHILDFFYSKNKESKYIIDTSGILGKMLINFQPNTYLSRYSAGVGKMMVGKITNYIIVPKPDPVDLQAELIEQQIKFKNEMNRIKGLLESGEINLEKLSPQVVQEGWLSKTTKEWLYKNRHTIYFWTIASGIAGAWISIALPSLKKDYPFLETATTYTLDYAGQYVMDTYVSQKIMGFLMGNLGVWVRKSVDFVLKQLDIDPNEPLFARLDKYLQHKYGIEILHKVTVLNIFSELIIVAGQMEIQAISYKIPTVVTESMVGAYKIREILTWENLTTSNVKMLFKTAWNNTLEITDKTNLGSLLLKIDKSFASLYPSPPITPSSLKPEYTPSTSFPPSLFFKYGQPISIPEDRTPYPPNTEENKTSRIHIAMLAGNTNAREQIEFLIKLETTIQNLEKEQITLKTFVSDNNSFLGGASEKYDEKVKQLDQTLHDLKYSREKLDELFRNPGRMSSKSHDTVFYSEVNNANNKFDVAARLIESTSSNLANDLKNIEKLNKLKNNLLEIETQYNNVKQTIDKDKNNFGSKSQEIDNQNTQIQSLLQEARNDIEILNNNLKTNNQIEFDTLHKKIEINTRDLGLGIKNIQNEIENAKILFAVEKEKYRQYVEMERTNDIESLNKATNILNKLKDDFNDVQNYLEMKQQEIGSVKTDISPLKEQLNELASVIDDFGKKISDTTRLPDVNFRNSFDTTMKEIQNSFEETREIIESEIEKEYQMAETLKDLNALNRINSSEQKIIEMQFYLSQYVLTNKDFLGENFQLFDDSSKNIMSNMNAFKKQLDSLRSLSYDPERFSKQTYRYSFNTAARHAHDTLNSIENDIKTTKIFADEIIREAIEKEEKLQKFGSQQYSLASNDITELQLNIDNVFELRNGLNDFVIGNKNALLNSNVLSDMDKMKALEDSIFQSKSILLDMIKEEKQFREPSYKNTFDNFISNAKNMINEYKHTIQKTEENAKRTVAEFELKTKEQNYQIETDKVLKNIQIKIRNISNNMKETKSRVLSDNLLSHTREGTKIFKQIENIQNAVKQVEDMQKNLQIMQNDQLRLSKIESFKDLATDAFIKLDTLKKAVSKLNKNIDNVTTKISKERDDFRLYYQARETINEQTILNKIDKQLETATFEYMKLQDYTNKHQQEIKKTSILDTLNNINSDIEAIKVNKKVMYEIVSDETRFLDSTYKSRFTALVKNSERTLIRISEDTDRTTKNVDQAILNYEKEQREYIQQQQTARDLDTLYRVDIEIQKITDHYNDMLSTVNNMNSYVQEISNIFNDLGTATPIELIKEHEQSTKKQVSDIKDELFKINADRVVLSNMLANPDRFKDFTYESRFKELVDNINSSLLSVGKDMSLSEESVSRSAKDFASTMQEYHNTRVKEKEKDQFLKDEAMFNKMDKQLADVSKDFAYTVNKLNTDIVKLYLGDRAKSLTNEIYNMNMKLKEYKISYENLKSNGAPLDSKYREQFDKIIKSAEETLKNFKDNNIKISDDIDKSMASVIGYYNEIDALKKLDLNIKNVASNLNDLAGNYDKNKEYLNKKITSDVKKINKAFGEIIAERNESINTLLESLHSILSVEGAQSVLKPSPGIWSKVLDSLYSQKQISNAKEISSKLSNIVNDAKQTNENINKQVQDYYNKKMEEQLQLKEKEKIQNLKDKVAFDHLNKQLKHVNENYNFIINKLNANKMLLGDQSTSLSNEIYNAKNMVKNYISSNEIKFNSLKNGNSLDPEYRSRFDEIIKSTEQTLDKFKNDVTTISEYTDKNIDEMTKYYNDFDALTKLDSKMKNMENKIKELSNNYEQNKIFVEKSILEDVERIKSSFESINTDRNAAKNTLLESIKTLQIPQQVLESEKQTGWSWIKNIGQSIISRKGEQIKIQNTANNISSRLSEVIHAAEQINKKIDTQTQEFHNKVRVENERTQKLKDEKTFQYLDTELKDINESFKYTEDTLKINKLYLGTQYDVLKNEIFNMKNTLNENTIKYNNLKNIETSHLDPEYRNRFDKLIRSTHEALSTIKEGTNRIGEQVDRNVENVIEHYKELDNLNKLDMHLQIVSDSVIGLNSKYEKNKSFIDTHISEEINNIEKGFDSVVSERNGIRDILLESLQSLKPIPKVKIQSLDGINRKLSSILYDVEKTNKNIDEQVHQFFETAKENQRQQSVRESLDVIDASFKSTEKSLTNVVNSERDFNKILSANENASALLRSELNKLKTEYEANLNLYKTYDSAAISDLKKEYLERLNKMNETFRETQNTYEKEYQKTKEGIMMSYKNLTGKELLVTDAQSLVNIKNTIEAYQEGRTTLLNLKDKQKQMKQEIDTMTKYMTTTRSAILTMQAQANGHKDDQNMQELYRLAKEERSKMQQNYEKLLSDLSEIDSIIGNMDIDMSMIYTNLLNQKSSELYNNKIKEDANKATKITDNFEKTSEESHINMGNIYGYYAQTFVTDPAILDDIDEETIETDLILRNTKFALKIGEEELNKLSVTLNMPELKELATQISTLQKQKDPKYLITAQQLALINKLKDKLIEAASVSKPDDPNVTVPKTCCFEDTCNDCKINSVLDFAVYNVVPSVVGFFTGGLSEISRQSAKEVFKAGARNAAGRLVRQKVIETVVKQVATSTTKKVFKSVGIGAAKAGVKFLSSYGTSQTGKEATMRMAMETQTSFLINMADIFSNIQMSDDPFDVLTISKTDYVTLLVKAVNSAPGILGDVNKYINADRSTWSGDISAYKDLILSVGTNEVLTSLLVGTEVGPGLKKLQPQAQAQPQAQLQPQPQPQL